MRREAQQAPALASWGMRGGRRTSGAAGIVVPAALLFLAVAIATPLAHAQDRERESLRRAQQMISRLQQDNAGLQREKAELEQKLKAADEELKNAKAQADRLRRNAKALQAAEKYNTELQGKLAQTEARLKDIAEKSQQQAAGLRKELHQTQGTLEASRREGEQTSAQLSGQLAGQTSRAEACEEKNAQLYSVTMDLIDRYRENRGAWEKFLISEPFTQLKSVEVENLLDDMRNKAMDNKIEPAAATPPADRSR